MTGATVLGPRLGEAAAFRNLQLAIVVAAIAGWVRDRGEWQRPLAPRAWLALIAAGLLWFEAAAVSRFLSFGINGVDFSIFDWMLHSTAHGRLGYSPIYDVNHFGVHSSFLLLGALPFYALHASPYWLLLGGPLLLWAGVFPLRRLVRWGAGEHGGFLLAATLAYLASAWMGRLVADGFRIEAFIPVLSLWSLVGWVERKPSVWSGAGVALLLSKEDCALFLIAFGVGAIFVERLRWRSALTLMTVSAAWLVFYLAWAQPALAGRAPTYLTFWSAFGATPAEMLVGMVTHPLAVARRLLTSGLWLFFLPLAFVPWASPRSAAAMAPTVFLLGTATYEAMHGFSSYYPLPLVALSLFGVLDVVERWRQRRGMLTRGKEGLALVALLLFPLVAGGYLKVRPVDLERVKQLEAARALLTPDLKVCAQTVLFPHLGYSSQLVPLFDAACADASGAVALVHPALDPWPFPRETLEALIAGWRTNRNVRELPGGFLLVSAP